MKKPIILPTALAICALFAECKRSSTPNCSAYTYLIAGTDSFHLAASIHSTAVPSDSPRYSNTVLTIKEIDPCTVSVGGNVLSYVAQAQDSIVQFEYTNDPYGTGTTEYLYFNHYTYAISISIMNRAGASGYVLQYYTSY